MIRFKLKEMLAEKAFREGKRINLDELSEATKIQQKHPFSHIIRSRLQYDNRQY